MTTAALATRTDGFSGFRLGSRTARMFAVLIAANLLCWAWALAAFAHQPVLLGTALLAYGLGLRHALDADHIAAIDNVTRKLMQDGQRPIAVGLFFSLGHSTVVVLASAAVALVAGSLAGTFEAYRQIGDVIGTAVSALFLCAIAAINLVVLRDIIRTVRRLRGRDRVPPGEIEPLPVQGGGIARLLRPLLALTSKSWHLFPIGVLFALAMDTATEVSLFGLSAQTSSQISGWSTLIFPALFTAGMTLLDTADGTLMLSVYGWAYQKPAWKLVYNLIITVLSVIVALVVGGIEIVALLADHLGRTGPFWSALSSLNAHFDVVGCAIVMLFAASWAVSVVVYRRKRRDIGR